MNLRASSKVSRSESYRTKTRSEAFWRSVLPSFTMFIHLFTRYGIVRILLGESEKNPTRTHFKKRTHFISLQAQLGSSGSNNVFNTCSVSSLVSAFLCPSFILIPFCGNRPSSSPPFPQKSQECSLLVSILPEGGRLPLLVSPIKGLILNLLGLPRVMCLCWNPSEDQTWPKSHTLLCHQWVDGSSSWISWAESEGEEFPYLKKKKKLKMEHCYQRQVK